MGPKTRIHESLSHNVLTPQVSHFNNAGGPGPLARRPVAGPGRRSRDGPGGSLGSIFFFVCLMRSSTHTFISLRAGGGPLASTLGALSVEGCAPLSTWALQHQSIKSAHVRDYLCGTRTPLSAVFKKGAHREKGIFVWEESRAWQKEAEFGHGRVALARDAEARRAEEPGCREATTPPSPGAGGVTGPGRRRRAP